MRERRLTLSMSSSVKQELNNPTVGGCVVPGKVVLNNCVDVHIGPKYVHTNNIIINQGVSSVELRDNLQLEDQELDNSFYSIIYKCSINHCCLHIKILISGCCLFAIFIIIIIVSFMRYPSDERSVESPRLEETVEDYPVSLKFVLRESWEASPPLVQLENNSLPLARVIFIHTASSGTCNKFASCKQQVLQIQEWHIENDLGDIGYNFVIGGDGYIYVGVGWDKVGSHTKGSNRGSIGVAFIGDFRKDEPNEDMLNSAKALVEFGVAKLKLSGNYQVFGHCQVLSDFPYSPGVNILKHVYHWSHWNNSNVNKCANFNYTLE